MVGIGTEGMGEAINQHSSLYSSLALLFSSLAFCASTYPSRYHLLELGIFTKQQLKTRHWLLEQYWLDFKLLSDLHSGESALLLLILIKIMCSGPHGNIIGVILSPIVHFGDSTANTN